MPKMKAKDVILFNGKSVEDAIAELTKAAIKEKKAPAKKPTNKKEG